VAQEILVRWHSPRRAFRCGKASDGGRRKTRQALPGDRGCQSSWQLGVGSPSRKAPRVGGKGKGSTPRQLCAREAIAVKSRDISDAARGREPPAGSGKPTELDAAPAVREGSYRG